MSSNGGPCTASSQSRGSVVGLSMAERKAVTKQMAHRYAMASKKDKGVM
jgi:hypothetical protein